MRETESQKLERLRQLAKHSTNLIDVPTGTFLTKRDSKLFDSMPSKWRGQFGYVCKAAIW